MVNQFMMFWGMWSRKISHSAKPRNRSSRRSRSVEPAGSCDAVVDALASARLAALTFATFGFATIVGRRSSEAKLVPRITGAARQSGRSGMLEKARPHGYCNNAAKSIHYRVESHEFA